MLKESIGRQLSAALERSGKSGASVAREVGRTASAMSRWISGATTPDLDELATMATATGHVLFCEIIPESEAALIDRLRDLLAAMPESKREGFVAGLEAFVYSNPSS
jgi:transcriptional regulator with XRE-family HTH domain